VDVRVVREETFLSSVEEVGSVVDAGLLGGRATEHLGLPGITRSVLGLVRTCLERVTYR
jgi:hypothetical protein